MTWARVWLSRSTPEAPEAHLHCQPIAASSQRNTRRPSLDAALALALAAALVLLGFITTGGFDQSVTVSGADTWAEIILTVLGTGAVAAMLVLGARGPAWGAVTIALFAALTALTALSIIWSVQPDDSWQAANLTLAYLMTFAGAAALARIAPERWRALAGAIAMATAVLSAYALVTKVFPGSLAASQTQGRLQAPLGYWNATGAMAALGLAPTLWSFTRRDGSPFVRGLAVPGAAILSAVVVLSYSRTALLVAILTLAAWLVFAPGRLRAAAMLAVSGLGTAVLCGWALSHSALTTDGAALNARTSAGHTFGLVGLVTVLALIAAGTVLARAQDRIVLAEPVRRQIGSVLLVAVALLPVAGVIALAASSRGLTGEISYAWSSLTSVNAGVGNSASRLTQFGSSRPLYWSEGITVGEHALFKGVGALGYATARTRYTSNPHIAGHAHSYVVQTFADLGLLGLAVNLALLVAWLISALRTLGGRARWALLPSEVTAERAGLLALFVVVAGFGLLSAVDWTWYFPAVTVPALLAAGWLSGRGPVSRRVGTAPSPERGALLSRPAALSGIGAVTVLALACAWLIWQPLRSANDAAAAITATTRSAALSDARSAKAADPLALQPRFVLSALYAAFGQPAAARRELTGAVSIQPQDHDSWLQLGLLDLRAGRPRQALPELQRSYVLDPTVAATTEGIAQAQGELDR